MASRERRRRKRGKERKEEEMEGGRGRGGEERGEGKGGGGKDREGEGEGERKSEEVRWRRTRSADSTQEAAVVSGVEGSVDRKCGGDEEVGGGDGEEGTEEGARGRKSAGRRGEERHSQLWQCIDRGCTNAAVTVDRGRMRLGVVQSGCASVRWGTCGVPVL